MAKQRQNSIDIQKAEFKALCYQLIDSIAEFIDQIAENPITPGEPPSRVQSVLGQRSMPDRGKLQRSFCQKLQSCYLTIPSSTVTPNSLGISRLRLRRSEAWPIYSPPWSMPMSALIYLAPWLRKSKSRPSNGWQR